MCFFFAKIGVDKCYGDLSPSMPRVGLVKRLKQVAHRKKSKTENRGSQIDIVTGAVLKSPMHTGKQEEGIRTR